MDSIPGRVSHYQVELTTWMHD